MEVEKINPIFSNDLEEEIVFEEIERVPLHLNGSAVKDFYFETFVELHYL